MTPSAVQGRAIRRAQKDLSKQIKNWIENLSEMVDERVTADAV